MKIAPDMLEGLYRFSKIMLYPRILIAADSWLSYYFYA